MVEIDAELGTAWRAGLALELSAQEVAILRVLAGAGGRVVSRGELQRRVGLAHRAPRRCDALISGVRRVLGPEAIVTVRGRGWRCTGDVAVRCVLTSVPA